MRMYALDFFTLEEEQKKLSSIIRTSFRFSSVSGFIKLQMMLAGSRVVNAVS